MIREQLAKIRGEIKILEKDTTGHTNRYVSLPSTLDFINPILAKHGVSITIDVPETKEENSVTKYHFVVEIGYMEESMTKDYWIPEALVPSGKGDPNAKAIQNFGATITYGQRYIYQILLGLPNADEDPDGVKFTPDDFVWWITHIANHEKNINLTSDAIYKQYRMFAKGEITKEQYKERGY